MLVCICVNVQDQSKGVIRFSKDEEKGRSQNSKWDLRAVPCATFAGRGWGPSAILQAHTPARTLHGVACVT